MDDPETLKQLVQSMSVGVAVIEPDDWSILFENAKFFQWFPPSEEGLDSLQARLKGIDLERAAQRLDNGRPFRVEHECETTSPATPLSVEMRTLKDLQPARIVVECRDLSKQKQVEYMLESYSNMAEKNARELQKEKDRVEKLLLNIMPKSVYEEMKDYGSTTPQRFEMASVIMLDFVDFTEMAISRDPTALIAELNDIFSAFDRIVELFGCERIKTIGDAYMAVSGMPEETADHAQNIAKVALRVKRYLEKRNAANPQDWRCRIGINTGPIIGSIVGVQKYVYD
ncbi:MAG: adenylate/guanylate cyclase domain-containing protein, partial [Rhodospirillaceae bacterium]|nr:adenylate/guanylate cyclase domain-containing protein [Rhodospirillaceae bacterium]